MGYEVKMTFVSSSVFFFALFCLFIFVVVLFSILFGGEQYI